MLFQGIEQGAGGLGLGTQTGPEKVEVRSAHPVEGPVDEWGRMIGTSPHPEQARARVQRKLSQDERMLAPGGAIADEQDLGAKSQRVGTGERGGQLRDDTERIAQE
jgi:hypothetical protein